MLTSPGLKASLTADFLVATPGHRARRKLGLVIIPILSKVEAISFHREQKYTATDTDTISHHLPPSCHQRPAVSPSSGYHKYF